MSKYKLILNLVFIGSYKGNLEYIRSINKELELEDVVYYIGFVSNENLNYIYKNTFALVFPSYFVPDNLQLNCLKDSKE